MKEELISVSVDELKEAEQEMTEFLAESFLDYLLACEETLSRKYKITKRDKKTLFDKVQKDSKTLEEIKKETFDNLVKRIHFSTEQICEYIEKPEFFKELFGLFGIRPYEKFMEEEAEKEAFLGLLRGSMCKSPENWEKHFSDLSETEDTTTYTVEELLDVEKGLISVLEEVFTNYALDNYRGIMTSYEPQGEIRAKLVKYADDAFLEGIEKEEFEDRLKKLTFDELNTNIKVSVSDVIGYMNNDDYITREKFFDLIPEDYTRAYVYKQYALDFFLDMFEDDLNDTEDTEE